MGDKSEQEKLPVVRLDRQLKYQGNILKIYEDTVVANGHEAHWDYIHHDGAAAVLPVTDDGKILMVRQYRNALDRFTLEIPAGKLDEPDEPKVECAYRELEEETGYRVESQGKLEYLMSLNTTVAFCDEAIDIFVAHHLIPSKQHLDEDEVINVEAWELKDLEDLIYSGTIIIKSFEKEGMRIMGDKSEQEKLPVVRLDRQLKYQGNILKIYEDTVVANGHEAHWDYIHHDGAAAVLPVTDDGKILMVRQYRNALDRFTLEIPAGKLDEPDEPKVECAYRELEEETGYRVESQGKLEYLMSLNTTVAFCDEAIDIFVAHHLIPSKQHLDEDEVINVEAWELKDLEDLIYSGTITDGKTIAAIMAYARKYRSTDKRDEALS